MIKSNIKTIICTSLVIVILSFTVAMADSLPYTVNLPTFKGDTVAMSGEKVTNDDYVSNKVDYIGGDYDAADFWVIRDDGTRISNNFTCYEGQGTYRISFNTNENSKTFIKLYTQNNAITAVNVTMKGYADLR
ncbi:MAG: hypothetical protein PWQ59_301 [Thermoanaerobacterium sp.]|jgi:hypothetical protein|uniref:DUF2712 domain-containing protein n=1 Tax=Thermoanaerobacterium TaxID=28895 RepID=UPI0024ABECFA|nr:DUF2712 domain-containing protein [Thermoanaerobacterium sp. CMT5567-10]MDI3476776.1 hypothetical protein [Thermoanaerobacterium sp.]WHE07125.1 DUF2712 domain-containing protein [Thermoanaerobacterium thermosaccharolyticum]MDK2807106.1 hypothetical protein [Thermoanaerobacterium sp.]MDN5316850.1 hypothetical protein [Thermoanaerobacterium sp.]WKV07521.1 DUF2712 domain-containing protein [Thermoanaerobacterium sp. CMT5567-10]